MQNVYHLEQGAAQLRAERLAEAAQRRLISTASSAKRREVAWRGPAGTLVAFARWLARPAAAARR